MLSMKMKGKCEKLEPGKYSEITNKHKKIQIYKTRKRCLQISLI